MGFHLCGICDSGFDIGKNKFPKMSFGDVCLMFTNGHKWMMPDMILHYVADHFWQPPEGFVEDIMKGALVSGYRSEQTKGIVYDALHVGYLGSREVLPGIVPDGFMARLEELMVKADGLGMRKVTNGGVARGL